MFSYVHLFLPITFFKTNRNEYKNKFICTVNRKKCFQIL